MTVQLINAGWVLDGEVGSGDAVFTFAKQPPECGSDPVPDGFKAKDYLSFVKGYLDPSSQCLLTAASTILKDFPEAIDKNRCGICTQSRFGVSKSGMAFFSQMVQKGHRYASPLIFPHSYVNTPGNLAAIEFGFAGPHMVFTSTSDVSETLLYALNNLQAGKATDMLVGFYEAADSVDLPNAGEILNGAVCLHLRGGEGGLKTFDELACTPCSSQNGCVSAILQFLERLL